MIKELKRVVITGLGVISSIGNCIDEFSENIIAGRSGVRMITKIDNAHYKTKFTAKVKDFNAADYFEKNEARKYDLFTHYAVAAADDAIKAYESQFAEPRETYANSIIGLLDQIRNLNGIYGRPANIQYAGDFRVTRFIAVNNLFKLI